MDNARRGIRVLMELCSAEALVASDYDREQPCQRDEILGLSSAETELICGRRQFLRPRRFRVRIHSRRHAPGGTT
jgi:hypothetical protein